MRWIRRITYWLHFRSHANELREELDFHRQALVDEMQARGLTPSGARDAARRALGSETYMREEARAIWLSPRLESLLQDWRYAWRGLRRAPVFTFIAIASLAVGIGANTAIFGVIHSLLLARLPIPAAEQLVALRRDLGAKGADERFSRDEFDALRAAPIPLTMFVSSGGTAQIDGVTINTSLDAVDGDYFGLLGIQAQRGRLISRSDDADAAPVAVVTDRFWRGRLNADSAVLGRIIIVDGQKLSIIGVAPVGFAGVRFPALADIFVPNRTATVFAMVGSNDRRRLGVTIIGRRPASRPIDRVRSNIATLWSRCCAAGQLVAATRGETASSAGIAVVDVSRGIPHPKLDLRGQYRRVLLALMAGVAILLLAACANVANLLLVRSSARSGELAVRVALGASRGRLVTQLVIESVQLSLFGALFGVLLARWGESLFIRARIGDLPGVLAPHASPAVLAFTAIISVTSGIIFGVLPALRVLRSDLITPLKQGGRRAPRGRRNLMDRGLVALQAALALLLVSGATLFVQTLRNLQQTNLGFDASQQLAVTVETRRTSYARQGMTSQMADEMLQRVRALPGVRTAGFGTLVPVYGGRGSFDNVTVRGAGPTDADAAQTSFAAVTPGYFATLGIPLVSGHDIEGFGASGASATSRDVVINELFAKKFFPNRDPIGQVFEDSDTGDTLVTENHVIGVVASSKFMSPRAPADPMYFVPVANDEWPYLVLIVRPADGALETVGPAVARAIASVAPGIAQSDPALIAASIDSALARERISAGLAALFGAIALSLVAVGLYGVMLYHVSERTNEIGIRMALGASSSSVLVLVLRESLAVVGIGLAAGIPLALVAGRAVGSQLYGVTPYGVVSFSIAAGSLMVVTVAASLIPARKAAGVDPLVALRAE